MRGSPAVTAAVAFLHNGLARRVWSRGSRLPTTLELARRAGVSKSSMNQAVKLLVAQGVLSARPRQGIRIRAKSPEPAPSAPPRSGAEAVSGDLVRNILAGSYAARDELPSLKELQAHFGVCYRTMKRAVDSLVAEGILSPRGRGYRLQNRAPGFPLKTLVLVVGREYDEHLSKYSYARSFFYPLLYALERECSRRNVRLEVVPFPARIRDLSRRKDAIAYFVALDTDPEQETLALVGRLLGFGVPVLVKRESDSPAFASLPATPNLVFLEASNELGGFQVGQYLLARKYERAIYVTHSAARGWSMDRCRGLERAFRLAKMPDAVTVVNLSHAVHRERGGWQEQVAALLDISDVPAWVACDDALASGTILPVLRARGITPGTGASVISFNDQLEAFEDRLTSYNFNTDGLAAAVLFHAQFPERLRRRAPSKRHDPVLLGGYIIDRGSVRAGLDRAATPGMR